MKSFKRYIDAYSDDDSSSSEQDYRLHPLRNSELTKSMRMMDRDVKGWKEFRAIIEKKLLNKNLNSNTRLKYTQFIELIDELIEERS